MTRYWLLLVLLLPACSDPVIPPDACEVNEFACLTPGVDLEVVSVGVSAATTDAATGLGIVQPDSVSIRYEIRNRGSVQSEVGVVIFGLGDHALESRPHGALAPGEAYRDSFVVNETGRTFTGENDRLKVRAGVWAGADTATDNNAKESGEFHLAVPILDVRFTTTPMVVAGGTVQLRIVARNRGTHADAPADSMLTACLYDNFRGCTPEFRTTTSGFALPRVPAGETRELDVTLTIPPSAAWQDASTHYSMYLCRGTAFSYLTDENSVSCITRFPRALEVKPDYETVCNPPHLADRGTVVLNDYNCGLRPSLAGYSDQTQRHRFHVVTLDAIAGFTYRIQRSDPNANIWTYDAFGNFIRDRNPAPDMIQVDVRGRIYLSMYSPSASLTISAASLQGGP